MEVSSYRVGEQCIYVFLLFSLRKWGDEEQVKNFLICGCGFEIILEIVEYSEKQYLVYGVLSILEWVLFSYGFFQRDSLVGEFDVSRSERKGQVVDWVGFMKGDGYWQKF